MQGVLSTSAPALTDLSGEARTGLTSDIPHAMLCQLLLPNQDKYQTVVKVSILC